MKGSVFKRGKSWYGTWDEPRGPSGERAQRSRRLGKTKAEAEAKLAEIINAINKDAYVRPSSLTVAEFLLEHWLPVQETRIAPKTFERWSGFVHKRFIPEFGTVQLAKLSKDRVVAAYTKWLKSGGRKGYPLAPLTVKHLHRALSHALKRAVADGKVIRNVCDHIELPRVVAKEMHFLDECQAGYLLEALRDTPLALVVKVALHSGLRRGELLALTWDAVEFDQERIVVRQSLEQTRAGIRVKEPKTKGSRRSVSLDAGLMDELRRHRLFQRKERMALGLPSTDKDFVFPQPPYSRGSKHQHPVGPNVAWPPHSLSSSFRWYVTEKATELPADLRFHDLRHTHVALLGQAGVHPQVVSERLGHSSVSFTLQIYGHTFDQQDKEAASAIAAVLGKGA